MRILDLYCCEGGAGQGYSNVGFEVVGVDISPQPRYPFEFHQGDAIEFLIAHGHEFDAVHGSPPCQLDSHTHRLWSRDQPDLIEPTREAMILSGKPYVIENVVGAASKLRSPIMLCGAMFDSLRVYRHRLFESSFKMSAPHHPAHVHPQVKMGRLPKDGEWVQPVGNFAGVAEARSAMQMPWASRDGLREAIPPAYARWVGLHLKAHLIGFDLS